MWKVGLIGTGYWSEHHLNAWGAIENVQIQALCNRSKEKMALRAEQFGIPHAACYNQIDEFLEQADIDIVDIVTGPETHAELVEKIAKAGKHIMCQKPFALSLEEAKQMTDLTRHYGVRMMITENWRWLQPNQIIKKLLNEKKLGNIHVARYIHTDYYTPRMSPGALLPQPFFREMPRLLFLEMGAHWFDTIRFFFGNPQRLYAETKRISPYIAGEDSGIVTLGYDDYYVVLDMSWATRRELASVPGDAVQAEHREQLIIEGDLATLKLYMNGDISLIDQRGVESVLYKGTRLDHDRSHVRLQQHFIDCLQQNIPFQTGAEDNIQTLQLVFATYESARKHEVIHFFK
ncbi:Gfo/Idh/MocA family protein [Paenibacillus sp. PAMC21692]|uniref:Gfo/Idh/MocA family protein n=1 Tax=Paenibacillus sp. PAMC21692 TaxID=2762320 RepID=UPI00164D11DB|nr:Gfo/Idh/MocA family oxidoreductase [Paenibacillus sp. PAMC21692]QNK57026.1 Gfo/Idh/MocA family oxidoreductase [Paenibacillus sp. PAMC21692]